MVGHYQGMKKMEGQKPYNREITIRIYEKYYGKRRKGNAKAICAPGNIRTKAEARDGADGRDEVQLQFLQSRRMG